MLFYHPDRMYYASVDSRGWRRNIFGFSWNVKNVWSEFLKIWHKLQLKDKLEDTTHNSVQKWLISHEWLTG